MLAAAGGAGFAILAVVTLSILMIGSFAWGVYAERRRWFRAVRKLIAYCEPRATITGQAKATAHARAAAYADVEAIVRIWLPR